MKRYSAEQVLAWVADCMHLGAITTLYVARFNELIDQANEAEHTQRQYEQALGNILAGAVVDLAEAD